MKVVGICGSARKDGNTAQLIKIMFEELNKQGIETELVQFAGELLEPCKACWACGGQKNCVHKDDKEGIQNIQNLAENMAFLMKKVNE